VGTISRRNLIGRKGKRLILVDHNEKSQAVLNIEEAEILEIIDHHRLGSLETMAPILFRNQPVGCTATIMYQIYQERELDIPVQIAGLLCSAILSDTLMFRSPTCTLVDRNAGEELAKLADIDYEEFAKEMFHAGSNLGGKSAKEILHQDFKKFTVDDLTIGIGQINSMSADELVEIKEKIMPELKEVAAEDGLDMLFFMLTNIIEESSEVVFAGSKALHTLNHAFGLSGEGDSVTLSGVVSRKKQLLPSIVEAIQQ
jgi:manganese-dependent inorganic pyrophosphatase